MAGRGEDGGRRGGRERVWQDSTWLGGRRCGRVGGGGRGRPIRFPHKHAPEATIVEPSRRATSRPPTQRDWRHRQGLTLVPIPARLEGGLPFSAQLQLTVSPIQPKISRGCGPKVLNLSSKVSDVFRRSSSSAEKRTSLSPWSQAAGSNLVGPSRRRYRAPEPPPPRNVT